jgi:signal transduction histidine kinase
LAHMIRLIASHFELFALERNINFSVHTPSSLFAEIDQAKLQRILFNLLSNAFKYTPEGGKIDITLEEKDGQALFKINDSGPGIAENMREAIFERFRQLDNGRIVGGTGLGLAIVKEFVALHRGSVEVGNAPQGGASFKVSLPSHAPADSCFIDAVTEEGSAMAVVADLSSHASKKKEAARMSITQGALVLIVEDNPDMNAFLADTLSGNYRVERAYNGEQGLEKALQYVPDLIVSDVMMPEMSGDQMARELLAHPETKTIPLLLLTAKMDDTLKVSLLKEGVQDYISKPFSVEELQAKVGQLILQRRRTLAEREALIKQLTLSNEELQRFAFIASHDLKSPLHAIDNLSEWIEEDLKDLLPEKSKEHMQTLRSRVRRMGKLLDDILNYSRIGYSDEQRSDIVEGKVLMEDILALIAPARNMTIKISDTINHIHLERMPLQQILYNLIVNAVNHHDKENGIIEVACEENATHYVFSVKDDGPGIAPQYHEKIFDMFQTLKPRDEKEGSGMGLAFIKKTLAIHECDITVQSALGKGSIFSFNWPKEGGQYGQQRYA